jgi:hypothetical protein
MCFLSPSPFFSFGIPFFTRKTLCNWGTLIDQIIASYVRLLTFHSSPEHNNPKKSAAFSYQEFKPCQTSAQRKARAKDNFIFLHALTNLPLGNATRNIYFHTGELAFPPQNCQSANRMLQNYKTTIIKGTRSTEDMIEASLDYAPVLELFEDNFYLNKLAGQLEAYKMSCSKKNTPPRHHTGGALKYSSPYHNNIEGDEGRIDESYAEESFYN